MAKKNWKDVVKDLEKGKSFKEATVTVPNAVRIKRKRFPTSQISTRQQQAISRG